MEPITKNNFHDLAIADIKPHPRNPRPRGAFKKTSPKMAELIASVKETGVLQPITVRAQGDGYELIMGERRLAAAGYAGLAKIPAVVRSMTDDEAFAALLTENVNREDLDPILMARGIAAYQADGYDLKTIAALMAKSYAWVCQHAQIANLSEKWCSAIAAEEMAWSIENLLLIARYDHGVQDALYDELVDQGYEDFRDIRLDERLARYHHDVSRTPWDRDDAELVPGAGACRGCPKRTSCQKTLFDTVEQAKGKGSDQCVDFRCWDRKLAAHTLVQEVKQREKHPNLIKVSHSWGNQGDALGSQGYEVATKKTDGAIPALMTDGPKQSALLWVVRREHSSGTKATAARAARDAGQTPTKANLRAELQEKREALAKRRTLLAWSALRAVLEAMAPEDERYPWEKKGSKGYEYEDYGSRASRLNSQREDAAAGDEAEEPILPDLPTGTVPKTPLLTAWAILHGVRPSHRIALGEQDALDGLTAEAALLHRALWRVCWETLHDKLNESIVHKNLETCLPDMVATLIKVDLAGLVAKATEAITQPKAWEVQYGDLLQEAPKGGTKKTAKGAA